MAAKDRSWRRQDGNKGGVKVTLFRLRKRSNAERQKCGAKGFFGAMVRYTHRTNIGFLVCVPFRRRNIPNKWLKTSIPRKDTASLPRGHRKPRFESRALYSREVSGMKRGQKHQAWERGYLISLHIPSHALFFVDARARVGRLSRILFFKNYSGETKFRVFSLKEL